MQASIAGCNVFMDKNGLKVTQNVHMQAANIVEQLSKKMLYLELYLSK